ncbi:MAG: hypothetical protein QXL94_06870 [Candidatus Parvarchaeum sp.]
MEYKNITEDISYETALKIRAIINSGDYPRIKREAIEEETLGHNLEAGCFWMMISAPRRSANYLAADDVFYSAKLFNIKVPDYIKNMRGLSMPEHWYKYIMGYE